MNRDKLVAFSASLDKLIKVINFSIDEIYYVADENKNVVLEGTWDECTDFIDEHAGENYIICMEEDLIEPGPIVT